LDHERVNIRNTIMSCGVMELSRINSDVNGVLYALASRMYHKSRGDPCAFFIFSDVWATHTCAEELRKLVGQKNLGDVIMSSVVENPRTGNGIVVYTWAIYHEKFKAWYKEERMKRFGRVGT